MRQVAVRRFFGLGPRGRGGQPLDKGGEAIDEPYFEHQYQGRVDRVHNAVPVHVPVRVAGQIGE